MTSQIVNVNSALNYISMQTGLSVDIIRTWYPSENSRRNILLNVRSAFYILQRMKQIGFGETVVIPASADTSIACSVNTFKSLYAYVMGSKSWNIITKKEDILYGKKYKSLTPESLLNVTLVGGGAGGSGAGWGATDKNDTPRVKGGDGAAGGASYIYVNDEVYMTAEGAPQTIAPTSDVITNANLIANGTNGDSGRTTIGDITLSNYATIAFYPGYGGGGGGAMCFRIINDDYNGVTVSGKRGAFTIGGNGEYVIQNSLEASAAGGGGGAEGYYKVSTSNSINRMNSAGGKKADVNGSAGTAQDGSAGGSIVGLKLGEYAIGGKGGNSRGVIQSEDSVGSAGRGGYGGNSKLGDNVGATGGNGGCSGSISCNSWTNFLVNQIE